MALVIFYEKPGCINNTRQKKMLVDAGHRVEARNLLEEAWDPAELMRYFAHMPVAQWFNRSAPQIKSGEVIPEQVAGEDAIRLMINSPLLIRRPLMQIGNQYKAGFDPMEIDRWIGLVDVIADEDLETCPRTSDAD